MDARIRLSPTFALVTALAAACSDATTSPAPTRTSFAPTASFSGSTSGGGGGGSPRAVPQIAGTWQGQEHYDPTLSVFFTVPGSMDPIISMTLSEDAAGNVTGVDNRMGVVMTGKASANGNIVLQDGTYYGQKLTMSVSDSITCSDGSSGSVMSGKFQRKEGFGTISVDNCPVPTP